MVRVMTPDRPCVEVDGLGGRRYTVDRRGSFEMTPRDAKALIAEGGFVPSLAGTTGRNQGYRCPACGFGSVFTTCGRCGGHCDREGSADG